MSKRRRRKERKIKHLLEEEKKKPKEVVQAPKEKKRESTGIKRIYEKHYKSLLIIPFLILFLALVQIGIQAATTGEFIQKDVTLKGGITISIPTEKDINALELQEYLRTRFLDVSVEVRTIKSYGKTAGILIESDISHEDKGKFEEEIEKRTGIERSKFSIEEMGGSLGSSFFRQTLIAMIIAFVCMGAVVFIYFKNLAPSIAVILAAFSDIVVTVAVANVLGIKLSAGGIAAFLMLIGYSVDTDMLLSTRVLKRKEGTVMTRVYGAMKTGLTMTATTIAAVTIGLIISASPVLKQIMTILLIGLIIDLINTWVQNVGIIRLYLEKKGKNVKD